MTYPVSPNWAVAWIETEASECPRSIWRRLLPELRRGVGERMARELLPTSSPQQRNEWGHAFEGRYSQNFTPEMANPANLSAEHLLATANGETFPPNFKSRKSRP